MPLNVAEICVTPELKVLAFCTNVIWPSACQAKQSSAAIAIANRVTQFTGASGGAIGCVETINSSYQVAPVCPKAKEPLRFV